MAIAPLAAAAALGGTPVHVVTANDYLAGRDAEELRPSTGAWDCASAAIAQPMEMEARRSAYGRDIAYCTAKELAFDYLRDGCCSRRPVAAGARAARAAGTASAGAAGLCMAILDEADTLLVDEARVPLVLSRPEARPPSVFHRSRRWRIADRCTKAFTTSSKPGESAAAAAAQQELARWPADAHPLFGHLAPARPLELAIVAIRLLRCAIDYVVRDGQVLCSDETTGRAGTGRPGPRAAPAAGTEGGGGGHAAQRHRDRDHLPGLLHPLPGTAGQRHPASGRPELRGLWLAGAGCAARRRACARYAAGDAAASAQLWEEVRKRKCGGAGRGRPVLVGTETVAQSEALSGAAARGPGAPGAQCPPGQGRELPDRGAGSRGRSRWPPAWRAGDRMCRSAWSSRGGLHVILCQLHHRARSTASSWGGQGARAARQRPRCWPSTSALPARWWPRRVVGAWCRPRGSQLLPCTSLWAAGSSRTYETETTCDTRADPRDARTHRTSAVGGWDERFAQDWERPRACWHGRSRASWPQPLGCLIEPFRLPTSAARRRDRACWSSAATAPGHCWRSCALTGARVRRRRPRPREGLGNCGREANANWPAEARARDLCRQRLHLKPGARAGPRRRAGGGEPVGPGAGAAATSCPRALPRAPSSACARSAAPFAG